MTQAFNLSQFANKVNTSGLASLTTAVTGTLPIANGGTNTTATPTSNGIAYGNGTAIAYTAAGTTGQVLIATTSGAPTWGSASVTGTLINIQYFTSTGSYTKATNNPSFVIVEVVGGGGSGNGSGNPGNAGGTSSFGAFTSATGGSGGTTNTAGTVAAGGTGSGGDLNVTGSSGSSSSALANSRAIGGTSVLGPIGQGSVGISGTGGGKTTFYPTSGGGGGYSREKILATSLASSETVTVGAGGTAPIGGVAGSNGIVIVYEYK